MSHQSRRATKRRPVVFARRTTQSGGSGHSFPSGCCRKRPSLRCKGSPGSLPAFAFAPCAARFRPCNAFASIALTGPGPLDESLRAALVLTPFRFRTPRAPKSLSVNKSRVRTRQVGPSARSEAQPWVAPQGQPSDKAIGPKCPFPKGLTPMRGLLCRPARAWGLPRPSPSFAHPIALGSNASRALLTDKL